MSQSLNQIFYKDAWMNFAVSLSVVIKSLLLLKSGEINVVNQWSTPLTPIVNNLTWSYVTASKK